MNKRIIVVSLLAAGALSMWGFSIAGSGQPAGLVDSDQTPVDGPVITVSAVGSVTLEPNRVTVTIGTQTEAPTANEAVDEANRVIDSLAERIASLDLPGVTIAVGMVQAWPTRQRAQNVSQEITVFNAMRALTVSMDSLNGLGQIYDIANEVGAEQIGAPVFDLKNQDEVLDQALRLAVRQGMKKVRSIADEMGMSDVQWQSIEEVQLQNPVRQRIMPNQPFSQFSSPSSMTTYTSAKVAIVAKLGYGNETDTHGKHE